MHNHFDHEEHRPRGGRFWWPVLAFAGALGLLLIFEHRAHIPADLFLLGGSLLLFGGMHVFMHGSHGGGHGGHGGHHGQHGQDASQSVDHDEPGAQP
jgi:hypothetical protein